MNRFDEDPAWIVRARALLDRSTDALDAATLSRLNRARQAALAQRRTAPRRWIIGTGLTAVAAMAFALMIGLRPSVDASKIMSPAAAPLQAGDIDVLTSDDDTPDLYDDVDFYAWLDAHARGSNG